MIKEKNDNNNNNNKVNWKKYVKRYLFSQHFLEDIS